MSLLKILPSMASISWNEKKWYKMLSMNSINVQRKKKTKKNQNIYDISYKLKVMRPEYKIREIFLEKFQIR